MIAEREELLPQSQVLDSADVQSKIADSDSIEPEITQIGPLAPPSDSEAVEGSASEARLNPVEEKQSYKAKEIKNLKDVVDVTTQIPKVFQLLWSAHPGLATLYTVIQIGLGLTWVTSFWVVKTLVDSVPQIVSLHRAASGSISIAQLPPIVIIAFAVLAFSWFLQQVSQPIADYCRRQMSDRLTHKINFMIMEKVNSVLDITVLENPKFHDKLQHLQDGMIYRAIEMLQITSRIIQFGITFVSLSCLLTTLNFFLVIAIVAFATPKIVLHIKQMYEYWAVLLGEVPEVRKMRYYMSVLTSNLDGKEVRLFGLSDYFKERYQHVFEQFQQRRTNVQRKHLLRGSMLAILSAFGTICSYAVALYEAVLGHISVGSLAMFLGAIGQIEFQLGEFALVLAELYRHTLFVIELNEFMEIEPAIKPLKSGDAIPVPLPLKKGIEFRNVSFKYPDSDRLILNGVSFSIAPQQTVALVGENGAGKTTIVKLLSRMYEPSSGEILVDGIDIRKIDPVEWRSQMAVVFQDYCRFQLTVQENIGLGNVKKLNNTEAVTAAAALGGATSVVAKLSQSYDAMLGKSFEKDAVGVELSGGEWQKIALSRAFMRSSKNGSCSDITDHAQLLILDEPTASLDVQSEADVYTKFHDLTADTMALLITHRFSTVRIADKIIVLEHGKIIEEGSHEELTSRETSYSRLYNLQAERYK